MNYTVLFTDTARNEADQAYTWLVQQTPQHAPLWHVGLLEKIYSLEQNPARCPVYPQSEYPFEIRQLLFGSKYHAYRILFAIENDRVLILHIRHAAQQNP